MKNTFVSLFSSSVTGSLFKPAASGFRLQGIPLMSPSTKPSTWWVLLKGICFSLKLKNKAQGPSFKTIDQMNTRYQLACYPCHRASKHNLNLRAIKIFKGLKLGSVSLMNDLNNIVSKYPSPHKILINYKRGNSDFTVEKL